MYILILSNRPNLQILMESQNSTDNFRSKLAPRRTENKARHLLLSKSHYIQFFLHLVSWRKLYPYYMSFRNSSVVISLVTLNILIVPQNLYKGKSTRTLDFDRRRERNYLNFRLTSKVLRLKNLLSVLAIF